jgi:hypothetical protein
MAFKMRPAPFKVKQLEKVVEQLEGASKKHAGQAKVIQSYIDEQGDSPAKKKGKKDACYYKVKRAVKVWPSAYASGQLVQCRKRGAANYGNKSKK